jgi:hypothetical protein
VYDWRDLEPTRGNYDFTQLDADLAWAQAHGGKLGIRVRAAATSEGGSLVPPYLMALMPNGFTFTLNGHATYAPDWNDPDFLGRGQALLTAISAHVSGDPRLGRVDIGLYGDWGEFHVADWPYPGPTGALPMTGANRQAVIDWHVSAFAGRRLIAIIGDASTYDSFNYALGRSPAVGWRHDCIGNAWLDDDLANLPAAQTRWQTAPAIGELCGGASMPLALGQVQRWHISEMNDWHQTIDDTLRLTWKTAGYRYALNDLDAPDVVTRGLPFTVQSHWSNVGVAPTYDDWSVRLQLRDAAGAVAFEAVSSLSLRALVPSNGGPQSVRDAITLPTTLPSGSYSLTVRVTDPAGYYAPLALAINGRQPDGSYPLGSVFVR